MVALTGIEPAGRQFSSVQLGLSSCVFGLVQFATRAFRVVRMTDVLPRVLPRDQDSVAQDPRFPTVRVIPMLADRPVIIPAGYNRDLSCARNPTSADYRKRGALID